MVITLQIRIPHQVKVNHVHLWIRQGCSRLEVLWVLGRDKYLAVRARFETLEEDHALALLVGNTRVSVFGGEFLVELIQTLDNLFWIGGQLLLSAIQWAHLSSLGFLVDKLHSIIGGLTFLDYNDCADPRLGPQLDSNWSIIIRDLECHWGLLKRRLDSGNFVERFLILELRNGVEVARPRGDLFFQEALVLRAAH